MATRGRKPKPTALKALEGNPGRRALNENEPKPRGAVSACPDWLEDEAKAEWARMGEILARMGVLTEVDLTACAGYCQATQGGRKPKNF